VDRIGYHFLEAVVDQAKASLPADQLNNLTADPLVPEPIPETQEEIFKQANAAILDAFPRIPNPDREMILIHAFDKVCDMIPPRAHIPRSQGVHELTLCPSRGMREARSALDFAPTYRLQSVYNSLWSPIFAIITRGTTKSSNMHIAPWRGRLSRIFVSIFCVSGEVMRRMGAMMPRICSEKSS
jgi:hypothetical protein